MEFLQRAVGDLGRRCLGVFTTYKDWLAILGTAVAAYKCATFCVQAFKTGKIHGISRLFGRNFVAKYGKWAVVTGASEGVGRAFAEELAKNGVNVVIISRSQARLTELAQHLCSKHNVTVKVIVADFSEGPEVYDLIRKKIQEDSEIDEIGILINNVGVMYDYPEYFLEIPSKKLWDLVHVNMASVTMMTHMFLPQMVERGRGAIINMSSLASVRPGPLVTVYAATKTYVDYFTRALTHEYKNSGVDMLSLIPSYIATSMIQYSDQLIRPSVIVPSPSTYAKSALYTLGRSSRSTGFLPHNVQKWVVESMPESVWLPYFTYVNLFLRWICKERMKKST